MGELWDAAKRHNLILSPSPSSSPLLLLPSPPSLKYSSLSTTNSGDDIIYLFFSSSTFQAFLFRNRHRRLVEQQGRVSGRTILQTWPPDGAAGEGAGGEAEGAGRAAGGEGEGGGGAER